MGEMVSMASMSNDRDAAAIGSQADLGLIDADRLTRSLACQSLDLRDQRALERQCQ